MPIDRSLLIDTIYPAASAAYLVMNVPTPPLPLPTGYQLVDVIKANPQDADPAMKQADSKHYQMVHSVVSESSIFGLIAWNSAIKTAIVAIRGTKTIWEWIEDVDAVPVPYLPDPRAGMVHMGFQLVYEHIRNSIRSILAAGCPGVKRILVTGHSLGAAVALLCAFDIAHNLQGGVLPEVYTFAGPRLGAPDFAASFNRTIQTCQRVVNFMDVVPQLPFPPLYEHVGQEVLVHGGFRPLDITYAHHLTTYLTGLNKMPVVQVAAA